MLYLALAIALRPRRRAAGPRSPASVLGTVLALNYWFTEPLHTLDVASARDIAHAARRSSSRRSPSSSVVDSAARRREQATAAGHEADTLADAEPHRAGRRRTTSGAARPRPDTFGGTAAELVATLTPSSDGDTAADASAAAPARAARRDARRRRAPRAGRLRLPPRRAPRARGARPPDRGRSRARGRQPHPDGAARRGLPRPPHAARRHPRRPPRRCARTTPARARRPRRPARGRRELDGAARRAAGPLAAAARAVPIRRPAARARRRGRLGDRHHPRLPRQRAAVRPPPPLPGRPAGQPRATASSRLAFARRTRSCCACGPGTT